MPIEEPNVEAVRVILPQKKVVRITVSNLVGSSGTGDVVGPSSAVDGDFAQFDTTTGKRIKDGGLSLDTNTSLGTSNVKIPSQNAVKTYADTKQTALGFTPENVANKDVDGTLGANSDTKYPSQKATKTYADTKQTALGFTPENVANKSTNVTTDGASDTKYPSVKAVKTYADNLAVVIPSRFEGRLTTEQGVPVSTSDRTSQGIIYLTRFVGEHVSLLVGSTWTDFVIPDTDVSLALTTTSGKNYDVFAYASSGNIALELSAAWADNNTPTDAIAVVNGISVKSADHTRRHLGTIRASGSNVIEDSSTKRFLYNAYNQIEKQITKQTIDSHNYSTNAWQEWHGGTNGPHSAYFVTGAAQYFSISFSALMTTGGLSGTAFNGVFPVIDNAILNIGGSNLLYGATSTYLAIPGLNTITAAENAVGATVTFAEYNLNALIFC